MNETMADGLFPYSYKSGNLIMGIQVPITLSLEIKRKF